MFNQILRLSMFVLISCSSGFACSPKAVSLNADLGLNSPMTVNSSEVDFQSVSTPILADSITNTDLRWLGTIGGLFPVLSPRAEELKKRPDASKYLYHMLEDSGRAAIAHVILTWIKSKSWRTEDSASYWNGLYVEILPDGHWVYDSINLTQLKSKWTSDK